MDGSIDEGDSAAQQEQNVFLDTTVHEQADQASESDAFEFRLFSQPSDLSFVNDNSGWKPSLISLKTPEYASISSAQIRPQSYYIAKSLTSEERAHIEFAAVSGDDVKMRSQLPCSGLWCPWKVNSDAEHSTLLLKEMMSKDEGFAKLPQCIASKADQVGGIKQCKTRLGKKSRIKLRKSVEESRRIEEATRQACEEIARVEEGKAVRVREKKSLLNRRKQLKRRDKSKARSQDVDDINLQSSNDVQQVTLT